MTTHFSISMPVYGQAHFIETALKSLRCQTEPLQLAILDATPDDSVQKVLQNYQDIIHYHYHHPDNGQTAAIQEGWNNTSNEIVAWLNADDYYFPETLKKVANIFAQHPDVDVVYGHTAFVDTEGNFQAYLPMRSEAYISGLKNNCIISQPSCFVRRKAMEQVGKLNQQLHYVMDWDLWLRLYKAGKKFYFLDELLSAVRVYPETKTSSGAKKRFQEINTILKTNSSWLKRQITLLGVRYQHLSYNRNNFFDTLCYQALKFLRTLYKKTEHHTYKGIERGTNAITHEAEIIFPYYQNQLSKKISIINNETQTPVVYFKNTKIEFQPSQIKEIDFFGEKIKAYEHVGMLPTTDTNHVLSFQIKTPMRLFLLEVK